MPKCETCGANFKTAQGLKMHTVRKHSTKGRSWGTAKKRRARKPRRGHPDAGELEVNYCPRCGLNFRALGVRR